MMPAKFFFLISVLSLSQTVLAQVLGAGQPQLLETPEHRHAQPGPDNNKHDNNAQAPLDLKDEGAVESLAGKALSPSVAQAKLKTIDLSGQLKLAQSAQNQSIQKQTIQERNARLSSPAQGVNVQPGDDVPLEDKQLAEREMHFKNIEELIALRAPGLALNYLQRQQPAYKPEAPLQWLFWEQKHISLLRYMRRWQVLDQRVTEQQANLNTNRVATADRNWFLTEQLKARIELKQYASALDQARHYLWYASPRVKSQALAAWRRIIIQAYLNQGLADDARIALLRYQQDYGELQNEDGVAWLQLQAELLIQLGQYEEAISRLRQLQTPQAQGLAFLARLKAQLMSPNQVIDAVEKILATQSSVQPDSIDPDPAQAISYDQSLLDYILLVSRHAAGDLPGSISLMEKLMQPSTQKLSDSLITIGGIGVDADSLWQLYLQYGHRLANRHGLLKGDDEAWYLMASNQLSKDPEISKALLAVLSLQADTPLHRELSMKQLVQVLDGSYLQQLQADKKNAKDNKKGSKKGKKKKAKSKKLSKKALARQAQHKAMQEEKMRQGLQLVNRLFTESRHFTSLEKVSAEVRYRLIDFNLSQGQVKSAAALMANLQQPPGDQPKFDWNLRRARVLILSGAFKQGGKILQNMLREPSLVDRGQKIIDENNKDNPRVEDLQAEDFQVDKFLQVVFDLQAVQQYELSLALFNQLQQVVDDSSVLREITFWKAESYHGLGRYDQAAYLFLKSALSPEQVFDPWYHTATFRAAESLMDAGLLEDARRRFQHLLRITENAARKAVIRQRLQTIQLKMQARAS